MRKRIIFKRFFLLLGFCAVLGSTNSSAENTTTMNINQGDWDIGGSFAYSRQSISGGSKAYFVYLNAGPGYFLIDDLMVGLDL
jgi:hypothetical protein